MQPYRLKVLKCYEPTYDWKEGTEVTLCQRKALPPPESYVTSRHVTSRHVTSRHVTSRHVSRGAALRTDAAACGRWWVCVVLCCVVCRYPPCFRMAVSCSSLSFALGAIEPFFCELALFDVEAKKKQSESFHFHLNSPATLDLIKQRVSELNAAAALTAANAAARARGGVPPSSPAASASASAVAAALDPAAAPTVTSGGVRLDSSESKQAVFQLSQKRKSLYLVLFVYKIFQGMYGRRTGGVLGRVAERTRL
jgi:hypothetical protein